jgi:acyl-CoA reductase-like NAD-dependent aldehyde dehydrogenase
MASAVAEELIARNPATGEELGRVEATPPEAVAGLVERARAAQRDWADRPWSSRRAFLRRWKAILARDAGAWADALRSEVGKPIGEAAGEVVTTLDAIRWTIRHAGRALAEERLSRGWQRLMLVPPAVLRWRPVGVIGLIGTWNYPLHLTAPTIADALAAGNAVVFKPSERVPLIGERLRQSLVEAGFPEGLVVTVQGCAEVGRAVVASPIDKGHFTGGIATGRRVLADLAARGVPATAELSGFDAAIVLPDSPRSSTVKALAWAAYVNAGQTCIAVKRVYPVGEAAGWAEALADEARSLRVGDPAGDVDVGPLIDGPARERFDGFIKAAVGAGARILAGGEPIAGPGSFYRPTVLLADPDNAAPEEALAGCFGPVVLVRGVRDADAAVAAVNTSAYGLAASVWGGDRRVCRSIAGRLEAGMAAVNDAVAPSAHAAAPFGGVKASGFGRTHGVLGLREFLYPQVVHVRRPGGFRPQVFPYKARTMLRGLAVYRWLIHRGGGRA